MVENLWFCGIIIQTFVIMLGLIVTIIIAIGVNIVHLSELA